MAHTICFGKHLVLLRWWCGTVLHAPLFVYVWVLNSLVVFLGFSHCAVLQSVWHWLSLSWWQACRLWHVQGKQDSALSHPPSNIPCLQVAATFACGRLESMSPLACQYAKVGMLRSHYCILPRMNGLFSVKVQQWPFNPNLCSVSQHASLCAEQHLGRSER